MKRRKGQGTIRWAAGSYFVQYWDWCRVEEDGRRFAKRKQVMKRIAADTIKEFYSEPKLNSQGAKRIPSEVLEAAEWIVKAAGAGTSEPNKTGYTLAEFFGEVYLPWARNEKKPSTLAGYEQIFAEHLAPRCGQDLLRDFDAHGLQKLMEDVVRTNPELRRTTLRNIKNTLSAVFAHAVRCGYYNGPAVMHGDHNKITANPVRSVAISSSVPESAETYAYNMGEVYGMIRAVTDYEAKVVIAVAAFAGLRRSEIQGLEWQCYRNSKDGFALRIDRAFVQGAWGSPKSKKSRADVPVIEPLRRILDAYRANCGNPVAGPIFATEKGTPQLLNNILNRRILPQLNRCAICGKSADAEHNAHGYKRDSSIPAWHGWHGFRRALATNLHGVGVEDREIQAILRHSNIAVTQACYVKALPKQTRAAMNLFGEQIDPTLLPGLTLEGDQARVI